jgi:hypothetical protein
MTTISSTTSSAITPATNLQNSSAGYSMGQCSMAHDFFGSQAFGSVYTASAQNNAGQTQQPQAQTSSQNYEIFVLNENPQNLASYLLNEHFIMEQERALAAMGKLKPANNGTAQQTTESKTAETKPAQQQAMPTAQDYYMATQIANQFKNMPSFSSSTSFTDRDYFAQSTFSPNGPSNGFNFAV